MNRFPATVSVTIRSKRVNRVLAEYARLRRKARPRLFISLTVFGPDGVTPAASMSWRTE